MNELQIAKEVFLSVIKWFLIVIVLVVLLINLIWGIVLYTILESSNANISQEQDGTNNYQEINNG